MLKPVIAATAVLAIAGSSIVYAQQRSGEHGFGGFGPRAEHRHRPSAQDRAAFTDARIAALKAGLQLTPDQAKNWPAFEQALRDMAQLRTERIQAREASRQQGQNPQGGQNPQAGQNQQPAPSPFDRLAQRADQMGKTSAALKKVADTGAPLYQSLTDDQKVRFRELSRLLRPHQNRMGFNERRGEHGGWRQARRGENDGSRGFGGHEHHRFGPNGRGNDDQGSQL